jgi:hypothetical protein
VLDLCDEESAADLIAAARALGAPLSLLVLDPLRDLHSSDENESTGMARVMGTIRALRDILGCAIAFVHHAHKSSKDNGERRPGQKMRGSSAIHGAVDCGLYLQDLDTDGQTYWTSKVTSEIKAARGAGVFTLRLDVRDEASKGAVHAAWTVTREGVATASDGPPRPMPKAAKAPDMDLQGAVLACLREAHSKGWGSMAATAVRAKCGRNYNDTLAALYALEGSGFAERVKNGESLKGWRATPKATESIDEA